MAKLPYMKFFPADYLTDTRPLTPAARGIWMDVICVLWRVDPRGSLTYTVSAWARLLGVTIEEFESALSEFVEFDICDVVRCGQSDVRIESRRMMKELSVRQRNRKHQQAHRVRARSDQRMQEKSEIRSQKSEIRSQKSDIRHQKQDQEGVGSNVSDPSLFDRFWEAYPKRHGKRIGKDKSRVAFLKLSVEEQEACVVAARHYAQSDAAARMYARDPERFLKDDYWREWLEPEVRSLTNGTPLTGHGRIMQKIHDLEAEQARRGGGGA